jgi:hypothetical protein
MPDTRGIDLVGPATSNNILNAATLDGTLGFAHEKMDQAALRLFAHDEFHLTGKGYENRLGKLLSTIRTFAKVGGCTGSGLGFLTMVPVDLVLGRGKERMHGEPGNALDKGFVGIVTEGTAAGVSLAAELVGMGGGAVAGVLTSPASVVTDRSPGAWIEDAASKTSTAVGATTAVAVSGPLGIALTIARIPSLAVKYSLTLALAIVGGVVGFVAGSIRAIFNR